MRSKIWNEIEKSNSILLLSHESPDGDAIGSVLAFYHFLKSFNKNVDMVILDIPKVFEFLPSIDIIRHELANLPSLACRLIPLLVNCPRHAEAITSSPPGHMQKVLTPLIFIFSSPCETKLYSALPNDTGRCAR